jgi:hypothetical protein
MLLSQRQRLLDLVARLDREGASNNTARIAIELMSQAPAPAAATA